MTASPLSNLPLRVGIGGPVGSGKTALLERLCRCLAGSYEIAAITNDIYTSEDAKFLVHSGVLPPERIQGVETGGCPHTAIREDASINLAAVDAMTQRFPALEMLFVESGGDNLSATFSPELADITIYVIDVSAGDKIPRKGGPGVTRSDLLVVNKIDLAPHVGADLSLMARDAARMRGPKPVVFANMRTGHGVEAIIGFLLEQGGFARRKPAFADALPPLTEWGSVHAAAVHTPGVHTPRVHAPGVHAPVQQAPRFSSGTSRLPK